MQLHNCLETLMLLSVLIELLLCLVPMCCALSSWPEPVKTSVCLFN